jgi:hypothetical protein
MRRTAPLDSTIECAPAQVTIHRTLGATGFLGIVIFMSRSRHRLAARKSGAHMKELSIEPGQLLGHYLRYNTLFVYYLLRDGFFRRRS